MAVCWHMQTCMECERTVFKRRQKRHQKEMIATSSRHGFSAKLLGKLSSFLRPPASSSPLLRSSLRNPFRAHSASLPSVSHLHLLLDMFSPSRLLVEEAGAGSEGKARGGEGCRRTTTRCSG